MKRASYREAIAWIALNDEAGNRNLDGEPDDLETVSYYISSCLIADLFGVTNERVGKDILRKRKQMRKSGEL